MTSFLPSIPKKKENIRVFVQRKRLSSRKSVPIRSDSLTQLTSILNKQLVKKNKNLILVNYKPVFIQSSEQKSVPPARQSPKATTVSNPNRTKQQSESIHVPDVEDPFMFIEMMYQQLFTEDGQLRNETQPEVLANCVKQIVTQSRRSSMALRDSCPRKNAAASRTASVSSWTSPHFIPNTFSEEEEEESLTLRQRNKRIDHSTRSSKRSSMDHTDHQHLHTFLHSCHQKQSSSTTQTQRKFDPLLSADDTDNEDLDTFSDFNSSRRTIRPSPAASYDEDTTDSKRLSSGYHSLAASHRSPVLKTDFNLEHHSQPVQTATTSIVTVIQPIREFVTKYLDFILVSKNILFIPLFIFLLHQRPIPVRT
ncbi:unnamed protein product [Adineta ricciae]|uniref:Uncharacterized protein n=1 Tax=Adineta ricciae TaxID=249248 RepID=A0A813X5J4_ADIRI|nr:unnamed protein product [Adineta ricciae]